ncbi:MAG: hypothetical protein LBT59_16935 [Clostridiales bacterium]|jgi:hypothetical protein|nr:hypothetical protein [Clostridiales bacterium]
MIKDNSKTVMEALSAYGAGNYEKALSLLTICKSELEQKAKKPKDLKQLAMLKDMSADALRKMGRYLEAQKESAESEEILKKLGVRQS